jgi:hypothetical protein
MLLDTLGIVVWPTWLVICVVVHSLRRASLRWIATHAICSVVFSSLVVIGLHPAVAYQQWRPSVLGGCLYIGGRALLCGWAVSPGGCRFLYAPLGVLLRRWPAGTEVSTSNEGEWWSRSSTWFALVIALMGATFYLARIYCIDTILSRWE